ncbi:unnamed protein product [Notodromas monacha]|uniref:VOC domain-containing protein n=1 Tax=Notodromas monacha TaxID=399045 RepID=A0A7R9BN25_9CRUS|nr:unnamed protein product [Notodromas monacha]CAG0917709.1 unnamed protein product [Notodromas monacha]
MASDKIRFLHYVLKVGNRRKVIEKLRDQLKMTVLRHEEFASGCEATCNGPYAGRWSKTMIGYGPEDDHFVLELTYNYGIGSYEKGNDLLSMDVGYDSEDAQGKETMLECYKLLVPEHIREGDKPRFREVTVGSSDIRRTTDFWTTFVGLKKVRGDEDSVVLTGKEGSGPTIDLKFVHVGEVNHAKAIGRIAFSVPGAELKGIEKALVEAGQTILTPYISLDTPGKATVQVVIAADPDGHEICFVGDEGYRQLSVVDPDADEALNKEIQKDKSTTA